ncbi:MAG: CvpA family protein, partial [Clostridia bacterium]|nr:CvpA family protein [Clostridia bacterium]
LFQMNLIWSIALDVLVLAVFALCVILGVKKGFIRSIILLAVLALAFFASYKFTKPFAEYLNKNYISSSVAEKVSEKIAAIFSSGSDTGEKAAEQSKEISDEDIEDKKGDISDLLSGFSISVDDLKSWLKEKKDRTVAEIADFIAGPTANALSVGIAFLIIFFGTAILGYIALWLISKLFETEALSGVNGLLGGLLGAVKGLAICIALCYALCRILPSLGGINGVIPSDVIEKTYIVNFIGRLF